MVLYRHIADEALMTRNTESHHQQPPWTAHEWVKVQGTLLPSGCETSPKNRWANSTDRMQKVMGNHYIKDHLRLPREAIMGREATMSAMARPSLLKMNEYIHFDKMNEVVINNSFQKVM